MGMQGERSVDGRPGTPAGQAGSHDEVGLWDGLRVVYRYRLLTGVLVVTSVAAVVLYGLCLPREYEATTSIVPPVDLIGQGGGGLAGRLGGLNSALLQGLMNEGGLAGLYVDILNSRAVADHLIERFRLRQVYEDTATRVQARRHLAEKTRIKSSDEGIVFITVTDRDPNRAAALANGYVQELDAQNKRLSGGQATSKRVFLENRLQEVQAELSDIESLTSREARNKELIFEMLSKECELAKIDEAKSMPTIQVLDEALVPERPVGRGIVKRAKLAVLLSVLGGISLAFLCEYVRAQRGRTLRASGDLRANEGGDVDLAEVANRRRMTSAQRHRRRPVEAAAGAWQGGSLHETDTEED